MNNSLTPPALPRAPGADEQALYLYAILQGGAPTPPELPEATETIGYRDLLAVVSRVPLAQFGPDALPTLLRDPAWVQARALAHQTTLMALLGGGAVLPCAFCTVYSAAARVQAMLAAQHDALAAALRQVAGATEWGVNLFCDRPKLAEWLADAAEMFAPQRAAIARAGSGAGYMLRKRLLQASAQQAAALGAGYAQTCHAHLAAGARAATTSPPQPAELHGRAAEMILRAAYLVDDQRRTQFMDTLAAMQAEFAPRGVQFALTGPWPPYSFATLGAQEIT